jgi:ABC-type multidrug transport system ATPase subunit
MQLTIRNLSKTYSNGTQALCDVSLTISTGIFGLLGPNGAGKSTLMRILATLQEADSGTAALDGIDVLREKERVREILGYLPQEFGLYPKVTTARLLDHFAHLKGLTDPAKRREVVEALLHQTNLWDARNQRLGSFSGGMKQRFGIAQALLGNPKLIIVDEPTAGLDPEERIRFHNLLAEIGEQIVVILSTHIVSDVSDLCGSMAVIHLGRVLASGDPLQLAAALRGRIWRTVVTRSDLAGIKDSAAVISSHLSAGRTIVRVFGEQCPGADFESVEPEVEDVYFAAVNGRQMAASC